MSTRYAPPLTLNLEFWNYSYAKRIALESATQAIANDNLQLSMGMHGDPRVIHDPATGAIQQVQITQRNIPGRIVTNGIDATINIPYAGEPVTLTLDASQSRDPDGRITKFRWLSGTREKPAPSAGAGAPAAGSGAPAARRGRIVPEDADPNWPEDIEQPQVTLEQGTYAFSLWVIDDRGLVSAPDTLRIVVGTPPDTMTP